MGFFNKIYKGTRAKIPPQSTKILLLTICITLFFTTFVSASGFGYDNPYLPNIPMPEVDVNVSGGGGTTNNYYYNGSIGVNATQMTNVTVINIKESWITTLFGAVTKWIISSSQNYIYNDTNTIYFNESRLNETIDLRSNGTGSGGGNVSWNESWADTLYIPYTGATKNIDFGIYNVSLGGLNVTNNLNIFGNSIFNGTLMPMETLTWDVGSGASRWRVGYFANLSVEHIDASGSITTLGNITADFFQGNILNVTYINATNATLDRLVITDGTYTTIITPTTMTSDTLYAPLLQLGGNSDAHGNYAVAIGLSANATGTDAIAIGDLAHADGTGGVSIGSISYATSRSAAFGYWASASGFESLALGQNAWAVGKYASAMGFQALANGAYSTALGYSSIADGNFSVAIGNANASGWKSFAIGNNIIVGGINSTGFGRDGTSILNNTATFHNLNLYVPDGNLSVNHINISEAIHIPADDFLYFGDSDDSSFYQSLDNDFFFVGTGVSYFSTSEGLFNFSDNHIATQGDIFAEYGNFTNACIGSVCISSWSSVNSSGVDTNETARVNVLNDTIQNSNASWLSTYNSTYNLYSYNVSLNYSLLTYTNWNDDWVTTYNATYAGYDSTYNTTYHNYAVANYSNNSNYWDDTNTFNSTQMEVTAKDGGTLNILESWFTTLWGVVFSTKTTDDLTEGTTNLYDNRTWNETHADGLYWDIDAGSYNATYTLYNDTDLVLSVNTTANIQNLLNDTGIYSTYNTTYSNYATANYSNNSNYWDDTNTFNSTQMEVSAKDGGTLNILISWLVTLFYTETEIDSLVTGISNNISSVNTTANIQNLLNDTGIYSTYNTTYANSLGNLTWNQSLADTLYWDIDSGSYNATYDGYTNNVSRNYTQQTYDNWNDDWVTTYNATYEAINTTANIQGLLNYTSMTFEQINSSYVCIDDVCIGGWGSVNSSGASDTNETSRVNLINQTIIDSNASWLSTYNATYATYTNNVSRNYTQQTYDNWNDDWVTTYNTTYHNYATANYSNNSNYWDDTNTFNSTQMEVSAKDGGTLNILVSWLTSLFYTETEVDSLVTGISNNISSVNTTANIQNLLNDTGIYSTYNATYDSNPGNLTWNQSWADTLYWDIDAGSYNATYDAYADNVSKNYTERVYDNWNDEWVTTYNTTYHNYATANFSNKSNYWDDTNTFNSTQMEVSVKDGGTLNIKESWFTTLWGVVFSTKTTDDLTEGTTNLYDNRTWNETHADGLYWDINDGSYNATYALYNDTALIGAVNTTANIQNLLNDTGIYSTYNATYANNLGNNTFNESYTDDLYWDIDAGSYNATYALYNDTALIGAVNTTYNETYHNYAVANFSNQSNYWDDMNTFNATQMESSDQKLNILESWFTTLWGVIFSTKSTDDLTEGTTNLYDNRTWNETHADGLYWDINAGSYNATYEAINTTANIQNLLNDTGVYSTYNETYDANPGNLTWNQSLADTLYWDIDAGSYNVTYDKYKANVSRNYTQQTYDNWNDEWVTTYNATYHNYATANFSNNSNYWDDTNTFNATQMEVSAKDGGTLNILVSWLISLFYTETEIDSLVTGISNNISSVNTTANIQNLLNDTGIYTSGGGGGDGFAPTVQITSTQWSGNITYDGDNGYKATQLICDAEFTGYHLCNEAEIMAWFANTTDTSTGVGDAWCSAGGPKYVPASIPVSDCKGFTYNGTTSALGNYWHFSDSGGEGRAINCGSLINLSCCGYT